MYLKILRGCKSSLPARMSSKSISSHNVANQYDCEGWIPPRWAKHLNQEFIKPCTTQIWTLHRPNCSLVQSPPLRNDASGFGRSKHKNAFCFRFQYWISFNHLNVFPICKEVRRSFTWLLPRMSPAASLRGFPGRRQRGRQPQWPPCPWWAQGRATSTPRKK